VEGAVLVGSSDSILVGDGSTVRAFVADCSLHGTKLAVADIIIPYFLDCTPDSPSVFQLSVEQKAFNL